MSGSGSTNKSKNGASSTKTASTRKNTAASKKTASATSQTTSASAAKKASSSSRKTVKNSPKSSVKTAAKQSRSTTAGARLRNGEIWEWLFLFVFVFLTLCLFLDAQLGPVGSGIRGFLLGLLGFSAYPLMIGTVILIVIRMFWPQKRIWDKALLCLIFLLLLSVLMHLLSGCGFAKGVDCFDQPSWKNGGALGLCVGNWLVSFVNKIGAFLITIALMLLIAGTMIGVSVKKALKNAAQRTAEQARELGDELNAKREERLAVRIAEREAREKEEAAAEQERLARAKRQPIRDGSVDIATLDGDSYAEKKKRYEERMRRKEETGFDPYETNSEEDLIRILRGKEAPVRREKSEEKPAPAAPVKEEETARPRTRKKAAPESEEEKPSEIEYAARQTSEDGSYVYPSIDLLQLPFGSGAGGNHQELMQNKQILEEALLSFGVEAKVTQVNRGPAVTRYELQPKQGVKVSRIVNLADDIALNLAAPAIRIEAPIPGKSAVGIEVPNKERATVMLREVIDSPEFTKAKSKLTFALGKSIDGEIMVADVAKMPHLLIAGATGSGKSVCINSIIVSLLYKADPNEVQMMLIDPKMVELSVYNGIPHLCTPNRRVITDSKLAAAALNKMVAEMTGRYQKFAELNVRDIKGYNEAVAALDDGEHQKMPHIVIIIDELADLMMVAAKEVEEYICRLAQMARAAGMHLIIATQRPSVDVITGLIKANIPSRLAFAVSSGVDSRTILDMVGAEKLLGKGDMLFAPIGDSKPTRIQGTFISDLEVEEVVKAVSPNPAPMNQIALPELTAASSSNDSDDEEGEDEYLTQAIEQVIRSQKVSISQLQREFRIGFNRSARLVEELEERGIVSTQDGAGKRKVLVTWAEYCNTNSTD